MTEFSFSDELFQYKSSIFILVLSRKADKSLMLLHRNFVHLQHPGYKSKWGNMPFISQLVIIVVDHHWACVQLQLCHWAVSFAEHQTPFILSFVVCMHKIGRKLYKNSISFTQYGCPQGCHCGLPDCLMCVEISLRPQTAWLLYSLCCEWGEVNNTVSIYSSSQRHTNRVYDWSAFEYLWMRTVHAAKIAFIKKHTFWRLNLVSENMSVAQVKCTWHNIFYLCVKIMNIRKTCFYIIWGIRYLCVLDKFITPPPPNVRLVLYLSKLTVLVIYKIIFYVYVMVKVPECGSSENCCCYPWISEFIVLQGIQNCKDTQLQYLTCSH